MSRVRVRGCYSEVETVTSNSGQSTSKGGERPHFPWCGPQNTQAVTKWEISVRPFAPSPCVLLSHTSSSVTKDMAHSQRSTQVTSPHQSALSPSSSQTDTKVRWTSACETHANNPCECLNCLTGWTNAPCYAGFLEMRLIQLGLSTWGER